MMGNNTDIYKNIHPNMQIDIKAPLDINYSQISNHNISNYYEPHQNPNIIINKPHIYSIYKILLSCS